MCFSLLASFSLFECCLIISVSALFKPGTKASSKIVQVASWTLQVFRRFISSSFLLGIPPSLLHLSSMYLMRIRFVIKLFFFSPLKGLKEKQVLKINVRNSLTCFEILNLCLLQLQHDMNSFYTLICSGLQEGLGFESQSQSFFLCGGGSFTAEGVGFLGAPSSSHSPKNIP